MSSRIVKCAAGLLLALIVNTAYLISFSSPTIPYMGNVLLHFVLGVVLTAVVLWLIVRGTLVRSMPVASLLFLASAAAGVLLAVRGNITENHWILLAHIVIGGVTLVALLPFAWRQSGFIRPYSAALIVVVALPLSTAAYRRVYPPAGQRITNPALVPVSMSDEGGGPKSPFFPSSAQTNVGGIIPANFFMDSEACGSCHRDIYEEWKSSMHHFASMNNQFYRKSIEYMQDVVGTKPSKWCAGCHDHALFFNGRFDIPIKDQMDAPESHAGLACTSCHSIVHVDGSMGNGGFTIEYPPLHNLATSKNPAVRALTEFVTYLEPTPHKQTFMKPFMREDAAEYCSTCHKVHLDVPVNSYRWFRGFNDYDNWQASGVSGQGARSFYYPEKTSTCVDCHMPLVNSREPGNHSGKVHSHRFPAANTAVPFVNDDKQQLDLTQKFLQSGFITVDIFGMSPARKATGEVALTRRTNDSPQANSSFGAGEETDQQAPAFIREVGEVAAPIDKSAVNLEPGTTATFDVVVRTRKIGHFFPGGTVDAFDIWLEFQVKDATDKVVYWSGRVEDNGKGPVEKGAHFYRSYQLDGAGNPINKRNAFQARSVLYVRLIPPGAADVVHYRVTIPKDVKGPLKLSARLNYRKFSYYYTQFAYAGQPRPGQDASLINADYNSLKYSFDAANIPKNVSGHIKGTIPDLPIITLAKADAVVNVAQSGNKGSWQPAVQQADYDRWNDWGIGLLLQGDLKGAEFAFKEVTKANPQYADGWLNVARALIQEGETDAAKPFVEHALSINPKLGRIHFFKAMIQKADGDYDGALASLHTAESIYPRDRVVLNQIARILFLERKYTEAIKVLERVCLIDPEDVQMHYTWMLAYRGIGDIANAEREEKLFNRFKADESSQAITGKPRLASPEDNNERQPIHEHESASLAGGSR
jgi:tetratricopeptide (TPR) repeat protein